MTETGWSAVAGSPGPLEKKTPSGSTAYTSSRVAVAGRTCTSMPRSAIRCGVMPLMPRSIAATVNFFVPIAGTTYVSLVATSAERSAPFISGACLDAGQQRGLVGDGVAGEDADAHGAALAQVAGERAGVDAADADDALALPAPRRASAASASWRARRAGSRTT